MRPINHAVEPYKWNNDPLQARLEEARQQSKSLSDPQALSLHNWDVFHWSTRLKLEGAAYHYGILREINKAPENDVEDAAHWRLRHWHLDGFFFQLAGASETLLQEINALYQIGLEPEDVTWTRVKNATKQTKQTLTVIQSLEERWNTPWLQRIRDYRNALTHRHYIPTVSGGYGYSGSSGWSNFSASMFLPDDSKPEPLEACKRYLRHTYILVMKSWKTITEEWPLP